MSYTIRPLQPQDNQALHEVITTVVQEFGFYHSEYLTQSNELDNLYSCYCDSGSQYWIAIQSQTQRIIGGGGFSRLEGTLPTEQICELQKLYLLPEARGSGIGRELMDKIIRQAIQLGYQEMYLECMPEFTQAIGLYKKYGFRHLDAPRGNTGHASCTVYIHLSLASAEKVYT